MPTILVVEDDPDILEVTRLLLSAEGHRVIGACSANEGLDIVHARGDIDMLFTDVNLRRGMDGLALLERLRQENRQVPTVVVSGDSEAGSALPRRPRGPAAFLAKPYGRRQLLEALAACCGRSHGGPAV